MPRATVNVTETEMVYLKTCPDGFVKLRRMSYGEKLQRRAMTKLTVHGSQRTKDFQGELALMDRKVTELEFQFCIVEHNLEDEVGNTLVFPRDLDKLDPRIGEEIDQNISRMNNFEEDEDLGN